MGLTRYEMETVINYNAEEDKAEVYTRDKSVMLKLDKLVAAHPEIYKLIKQDDWGKTYSFPKRFVRFGKPLTEKQKELRRQHALETLNKRQNQEVPANE